MCFLAIYAFLTSCSSDNKESSEPKPIKLELRSNISDSTLTNIRDVISSDIESRGDIDEFNCFNAVAPLIADGENIQAQILDQISTEATPEDIDFFKNLSNEDLVALSFIIYTTSQNDTECSSRNINTDRLLNCVGVAIGYDAIKKLAVGEIVTAATIRQALVAIGKRYLGYIGLAIMVYDFVECIS